MNRSPWWIQRAIERSGAADGARAPFEIQRAVSVRAKSIDAVARTAEFTLATETPVQAYDYRTGEIIDEILLVRGAVLPDQVPLLADHNRFSIEAVRGSLRDLRIDGDVIVCRAHFATDADSEIAWTKVRDGHLTDLSVGGNRREAELIPAGEKRTIGGKDYVARSRPLRVITKWAPAEGSLVPIGADPNAVARSTTTPSIPAPAPSTTKEIPVNFTAWLAAQGFTRSSLSEQQLASLKRQFLAENTNGVVDEVAAPVARAAAAAPAPVITPAAAPVAEVGNEIERAAGARAERERVRAIREIAGSDVPADVITRATDEGWTPEQMRTRALEIVRASRGTPAAAQTGVQATTQVGADASDKFTRAVANAALLRRGLPVENAEERSQAMSLRGAMPQDIARAALAIHGITPSNDPDALYRAAISTYSFPTALGNTLNRMLQAAYESYPSTARRWCGRRDVKDFREHKNIKLGKFSRPEQVPKGGEIKSGTLSEEAEGYNALTYGQQLVFTREDFINDDIGIFDRVPFELGDSMGMNVDDIVYDLLTSASGVGPTMDSIAPGDSVAKALFATDRLDGANYISGATVLNSAGLTALKKLLRLIQQSKRPINVAPAFLLVPAILEQTALELVKSTNIIITGSTDAVRPSANTHQGTLEVIVEPRLDAATNGGTAFYAIARPGARAEHIAISFLRGAETPTIQRMNLTNPLAMGWLAYHDVGASAIDWRGIVRSKGA